MGDALQALAFSILGEADTRTDRMRVKQLSLLGEAVGFQGMALGQAIDLESEGKALSLDALKAMHVKKTGALITASVLMGAACGNPSDDDWNALTQAGQAIGLAFQIQDDILDEIAPTEMLGKTQGPEIKYLENRHSQVFLGLEASNKGFMHWWKLLGALARVAGDTTMLEQLARLSVGRTN